MQTPNKKLSWGIGLLALGYLVAAIYPVEALIRRNDPSAHHRLDPGTSLLGVALVIVEFLIIFRPLRRGEAWALIAVVVPMIVVGIPRLVNDSACQLYDLSHHGCHLFMIAMTLAGSGVILSWLSIAAASKASRAAAKS